jgi:hypothetical protein
MWRPLLVIILIFAALYGAYWYMNKPEISEINPDPINTNLEPNQSNIARSSNMKIEFVNLEATIYPRANYSISGRILSKRKYIRSWKSKLSKWDFVLGWGDAAKEDKIINLDIRQSVRWYSFKVAANVPMSGQYLSTHTANIHIIPDNKNIEKALLFVKKFDIVKMTGYLVDVHGNSAGKKVSWLTSTISYDKGDEASEIFLVKSLKIGDKIYK